MARKRIRPKNQFDVEMARVEETGWTIRFVTACACGTISLGAIAWAAVQIADRPAWLTLGLASLSLLAPPATWGIIHYRRVHRLYIELKDQIEEGNEDQGKRSPDRPDAGSSSDAPGEEQ